MNLRHVSLIFALVYTALVAVAAANGVPNLPLSLFHLGLALWGFIAASDIARTRAYFRGLAVVFGVRMLLAFMPALVPAEITPIERQDGWMLAMIALAALYFAFADRPLGQSDRFSKRMA